MECEYAKQHVMSVTFLNLHGRRARTQTGVRAPSGSPRRDRGQEEKSVGKEAEGCAAEAADTGKAGNAGRASAAGMLAFVVPGVAKAVHGKSGTCSGAL